MRTKQQIREQLINDPLYSTAVLSATEEDRKKIESTVEPVLVDLMVAMDAFIEKIKADPEAQAELVRGLRGDRRVIKSESPVTGSRS
jgi:hypothetical protein